MYRKYIEFKCVYTSLEQVVFTNPKSIHVKIGIDFLLYPYFMMIRLHFKLKLNSI